jgi:hypothetical protein
MGFHDLLTAVKQLSPEEQALFFEEVKKLQTPKPPDGLTAQEWDAVKEAERKLDEGLDQGTPALPYLNKLLAERYGK